ncbi:hypothetical protein QBC40DRAFT_249564 [Triangularia verruculosa]|uniref:Uncharacterized protein n=1 Tax=Triangularia verruculosa TaxID=2587418 RepID=A0AAN6XQP8_9PEZI|nr:hypothetical protein QBC40DRAFT_249564 [Triangularia verruculosa]
MAMFTLSVILLHLLFQEQIDDQPYYKAHCNSDGSANDMTLWLVAQEWQKEVELTHGPELAEVISRCVNVNFADTPDFGKVDFVHEVLTSVVQPLEQYVRIF